METKKKELKKRKRGEDRTPKELNWIHEIIPVYHDWSTFQYHNQAFFFGFMLLQRRNDFEDLLEDNEHVLPLLIEGQTFTVPALQDKYDSLIDQRSVDTIRSKELAENPGSPNVLKKVSEALREKLPEPPPGIVISRSWSADISFQPHLLWLMKHPSEVIAKIEEQTVSLFPRGEIMAARHNDLAIVRLSEPEEILIAKVRAARDEYFKQASVSPEDYLDRKRKLHNDFHEINFSRVELVFKAYDMHSMYSKEGLTYDDITDVLPVGKAIEKTVPKLERLIERSIIESNLKNLLTF